MQRIIVSAAALAFLACSDPLAPVVANVQGTYAATSLSVTTIAGAHDFIQEGGSLTLELQPGGTLVGRVFSASQGIDQALSGTWKLERPLFKPPFVRFHLNTATVWSDLPFEAREAGLLRAEYVAGVDAGVRVILMMTGRLIGTT